MFLEVQNVNPKFREELDSIIENVGAIHGERFVQHVKFHMNLNALIGLMITNTTLNSDCTQESMANLMSHIVSQLAGAHAQALGLDTKEETVAVLNTVHTLQSVIKEVEKAINKKGY